MLYEVVRYVARQCSAERFTVRGSWRSRLYGTKYQPIHPAMFAEMLQATALPASATFIDLGCGDGRALQLAHAHAFTRWIGVEYAEELAARARRNCPHALILCADATTFDFPPEPLVLFLFNPFTGPVMQAVIDRLRASLEARPRPCVVLYRTPLDAPRWDRGFTRRVTTPHYGIWQYCPAPPRESHWHRGR